jgi:transcriptional regulator with XRE-family HTH domain
VPVETRVREFRLKLGWNQITLAAQADSCVGTLQKLERGRLHAVRLDSVYRFAHALGVSPADLIPSLRLRPKRPTPQRATSRVSRSGQVVEFAEVETGSKG